MSLAEQNRRLAAQVRDFRAKLEPLEDVTEFARGRPCQFRIPGICNHNPETSVWAHVNRGGISGVGQKAPDICGGIACSSCHDVIDGRSPRPQWYEEHEWLEMLLDGILRSQAWLWREAGL